jgi:hypothetical protein
MAVPTQDEIRHFLHEQIELWNAGKREEQTALYRRFAADELVIEYIGQPVGDGWQTFNHMWDTFGGKVRVEVELMLVNGSEGACHHRNVRLASGVANPSIETYRFEEGRLFVRYFYVPTPVQ